MLFLWELNRLFPFIAIVDVHPDFMLMCNIYGKTVKIISLPFDVEIAETANIWALHSGWKPMRLL